MKKGDTILILTHHPLFVLFVHSGYFELKGLFIHMMKAKANVTRLHSSRMRTARLLPISPSMHCTEGHLAPGGGVCYRGGACLWSGGYLPLVLEGCIPAYNGADPPPVNRVTDTCKNITLPQLHCRR